MPKPPLLKLNVAIFTITGFISLFFVPYWAMTAGFDSIEILTAIFLFFFTGMSITGGYHRLWSHKTYDAHPIVKVVYAIGGAMALQNSILHWSSDHRIHHRYVDDVDKDPYSAKKGLWFSHIGWMLREYHTNKHTNYENCKDLQKDKVVMWQHNHYIAIVLVANFGITALLGWLNGNVLSMVLLAGVFRLVAVHHVTFFINSLAHYWGKRPYTESNTARDNGILAFFTFGEGYHNYHHIFEYDYRNGIRWWQYDPTKWMIRGLSFINLTFNLRKCPEERIEKAKAALQLKKAQARVLQLPNSELIKSKLQAEYEQLCVQLVEYYSTKRKILTQRHSELKISVEKLELDEKLKELKKALLVQKQHWQELLVQSHATAT
ncbi:fatty acid desaturase [Alteromonas sp. 5E99-2]|uniref:acyl-CoA desaturase n=1 Tax=Alteromonas sp. 5E99-2 TaxID=2817683 RepID=UPI001A99411A|nr:fatty acid desaturase [Alteromonas sp. 5E99-2]MBO1254476.1 fatty acid desaturase [Alteromonas sp. 5E99-2]